MATGAVVARILTQYSDKGSKQAQKDIRKLGKDIDAFGKKASKAFKIASAATVALAGKIGKDAVQAAIEDSKSQAILANNLRNVTGATDATIASVEDYISKQQMLANVSDTELRASFSQLVTATGDVTSAITLQGVALDTAAGTGADLEATSAALAKASQGNFTALKKLVPALDKNIVKNKDLKAAVLFLNNTYKGSAKIVGDTDPLKKLSLAYGEVLETLGYALMPAVIEFTNYLITDVLPNIEKWIKLNKDELNEGLKKTVGLIKDFSMAAVGLGEFVVKYKVALAILGGVVAGIATVFKTVAIVNGLKVMRDAVTMIAIALGALPAPVGGAAKSFGFLTKILIGFGNVLKFLAKGFLALNGPLKLLVVAGSLAATIYSTIKGNSDDATDSIRKQNDAIYAQMEASKELHPRVALAAQKKAKADAEDLARNLERIKVQKMADAMAEKRAASDARVAELKNRIEKKYSVKLTDKDTYEEIQVNAVEMLLKKQKDADAALLERIKARKAEVLLFEALNKNAERYTDLLKVLSDQVISSNEIAVLAQKWGMTTDAVTSYIFTIFAIKDTVISDAEVTALAKSWDISQDKARQYLEFLSAINSEGYLSEREIEKLRDKWKLTKEEANKYADFVSKIGKGTLNDTDITNLKETWGLTNQQVVAYIKEIGGRVDASGTILSAGDIAALGWNKALTALLEYINAQAKLEGIGKPVPSAPSVGYGQSLAQLQAQAAQAYRVMPPVIDPSTGELTARGRRNLPDFMPMANGGIVTGPTQALIGEAGTEAVIPLNRIGSVLSSLTNSDGIGSSRSNNTNITVNVAGSVTSQNDLVAAIRQGLLRGQTNGQTLTLQAI